MGLRPARPADRPVPRAARAGDGRRGGMRDGAPGRGAAAKVRRARGAPGAGPHGARARELRSRGLGPEGGGEPAAHRARAIAGIQGLPATARGRTAIPDQQRNDGGGGLNGGGEQPTPEQIRAEAVRRATAGDVARAAAGEDTPAGGGARTAAPVIAAAGEGSRSKAPVIAGGSAEADSEDGDAPVAVAAHRPVDRAECPDDGAVAIPDDLTTLEHELLADLFAIVSEHADEVVEPIDRKAVLNAFTFACEHHADQRRVSGEDFIVHPVGVAKICAGMRLDTATLCAALLHDTVEDTTASLEEVDNEFGEEVAGLVDGVTKLTGITFQSRDEAQAENYRKMMVAMATDIRVILIKLADRLHNMRTLAALAKNKQIDKARETLEIYAPIAHRLGIHAIKWELEDLAFAALHPRKYQEIKGLVNQQREEREAYVDKAGKYLLRELEALGIEAEISGRAKHFYSIYSKMTRKGREFNEIYDLTAMRVQVDSVKDCYGAVGIIHSLWKPLPGRFKDMIAMPKFNMYQALHTTVIGPEGRPLEIQIRTRDMHETAEYGVAAHWTYKESGGRGRADSTDVKLKWLKSLLDDEQDMDSMEFADSLKGELVDEEVFVFTPKGEVKSLAAGATPLDFAYEIHTDVGHRCVGARV